MFICVCLFGLNFTGDLMADKSMTVEEIRAYIRKYWKESFINKETKWPRIINFSDDFPIVKAEINEDGLTKIWPRKPLEWVTLKLTCPENMSPDAFEQLCKESVEEVGGKNAK